MAHRVLALCAGNALPFRGEEHSAIAKQPLPGKASITTRGIEGDEQADTRNHGGPDQALHHYPLDHHTFWRQAMGDHPLLEQPGAFGTNIALRGLTEEEVLLGDRFRLGSAQIEVSRPRQPCWKIEHRFGRKGMLRHILESGRCGWYYRVVEEGEAQAGDALELVQRGLEGWSMYKIFDAIWGIGFQRDAGLLNEIAELEPLALGLRKQLRDKLASG